jgi:DNA-binding NarL/FixJ family response regulator
MKRPTLLLADDHTILTEGLKSLLEKDFDLVATVGDGRALVEAAKQLKPDVIVADISMPLLNGLDALRLLKKEGCTSKLIFLTMHANAHYAAEGFRAGASGYLLKHSAGEELITAIREVLRGRSYISPLIADDLLTNLTQPTDRVSSRVAELTFRQREVLQLIAEGHAVKEIGAILHISARTVESHKYDMMQTLGVKSMAELVQYAIKMGLVSP